MNTSTYKRHILIVDDDQQLLEIQQRILERHGYRVTVAETAESALENLTIQIPDAVLLDINLNGASGLELIRCLREDPRTRNLPVILVSGSSASQTTRRALASGANDYVPKPIDYEVLLARLQNQLDARDRLLRLELRLDGLMRQGSTDTLTGIPDGPFVATVLQTELRRAVRYKRPLSFIILEVDPYEKLRREKGDEIADTLIQHAANVLVFTLRSTDVLARLRGATFGMVLPETDPSQALRAVDRLFDALEFSPFRTSGEVIRVSASAGISSFSGLSPTVTPAQGMISQSEQALENAKSQPINRVRFFDPAETTMEDTPA